jgi:RHS repeat-associated protein
LEYRISNLTYDKIGNIKTLTRSGKDIGFGIGLNMDNFTYQYETAKPNRLSYITDAVVGNIHTDDIKNQSSGNYVYDSIGQLTGDVLANLYYVYNNEGKVTRIYKTGGTNVLTIDYNASGQRQLKTSYNSLGTMLSKTWYVYDGGGNLVSTYNTNVSTSVTTQADLLLYGTRRLGSLDKTTGNYQYELSDHLGNVRATVKLTSGNAEVMNYTDYYPHGSAMPGRNYISSLSYKYGYQGQEKDGETGFLNFELRQYDARIGRWFNPDPMGQYFSPYLAMGNNPVSMIDPTGGLAVSGGGSYNPSDEEVHESTGNSGNGSYMDYMDAGFTSASDYAFAIGNNSDSNLGLSQFEDRSELMFSLQYEYGQAMQKYEADMATYSSGSEPSIDGGRKPRPQKPPVWQMPTDVYHYIFEYYTPTIYKNTKEVLRERPDWYTLTYNGGGAYADANRKFLNSKLPYSPDKMFNRDEFPFACTFEGGRFSRVFYVPKHENSIQGAVLSTALRGKKSGDKIHIVLVPKGMEKSPLFVPLKSPFPKLKKKEDSPLLLIPRVQNVGIRVLNRIPIFVTPLIMPPTNKDFLEDGGT